MGKRCAGDNWLKIGAGRKRCGQNNIDKIDKIRGMNVTLVTTAKRDEEAKALLKALGVPFRD